jgi:hypothetical protein
MLTEPRCDAWLRLKSSLVRQPELAVHQPRLSRLFTCLRAEPQHKRYYLYYISINQLATVWDWVFGLASLIAFIRIVMMRMTYKWLADKDSPYVFADDEMKRFNVDAILARITMKRLWVPQ